MEIMNGGWANLTHELVFRVSIESSNQGSYPEVHNWLEGESRVCETFRNPVLANAEQFVVKMVEVWGLKDFD